ncbi:MAG: putative aldehyde-dehydrogenase-like protein y4uC [Dehalococcoidia bacterium]|nr:putative aldehyde-dehydrogenase-like protein y4uC [Dehalococcoidia bacterium]
MQTFIGGKWIQKTSTLPVVNPYDGTVVDTVPLADLDDVETALATAVHGARVMGKTPAYDRYVFLKRAAELMAERAEELSRTITLEEGKPIGEARAEVQRAVQTLTLSAEEAKRIHGETVPLDAAPGATRQLGFTLRVPCGVVVAISPFNFPLNLVCHKVGPALAAGNAVIIKPASNTPLSAIHLTRLLLEAGIPPQAVQCVTGSGGTIGDALVRDPRVRKITFTGSRDVGEHIVRTAGLKRVTMELGSNSPLIIMPDADLDRVVQATVTSGYSNAGQVCISTQRVLVADIVYGDFLDLLKPQVEAIVTGNPLAETTKMGPMIRETDAIRVEQWIREAASQGARVIAGGFRQGAMHAPTVVADVRRDMRISCDELFGPAVAVTRFDTIEEAIALANDTRYGLSAGIFTQNLDWAMRFALEVESGNLMINSGPQWRADLMPYGGLKESGMGKEGPRYAVEEMTELKMVVFHL